MVNLNKTHVFVGGGFGSRSAYLYDWGADVWSDLPDIPTEMFGHECSVIEDGNSGRGPEIVLFGSFASTDIYIYGVANSTWRKGAYLLSDTRYQASSISFEDVLAFAGGFSTQAGAPKDSAVRYNITSDSWEDLSQKLEVGRAYATAIPVPDDLAGCSRAATETADDEDKMEDAFD